MGYLSCKAESAISISNSHTPSSGFPSTTHKKPIKIKHFNYCDLEAATNNFSDQKLLGKGSHGYVYKALIHGRQVAVKKPSRTPSLRPDMPASEVDNEIEILSKIHSPRLVNLLGFTTDSAMVADSKSKSDISFAGTFASSAFAACFAEICTIPLDTAKVRLQLQKKPNAGDGLTLPKYKGMLGTVATIGREEGLAALWKGIVPGLHRQCLFGGLRIGLYEPVKNLYVGKDFVGDAPLSKKILAGLTTGALAIMVANPTDLVKVRLQAEGKLPPGVPRRYSGALNAYSTIVKQEGFGALWTGVGPNVARNAIINAAELASYDQVKQTILKIPGFTDNVFTHLLSGLGAGFFCSLYWIPG